MRILAGMSDDPALPGLLAGETICSVFWSLAAYPVGLLYTAVRAALTSHRRQQPEDAEFARRIATRRQQA